MGHGAWRKMEKGDWRTEKGTLRMRRGRKGEWERERMSDMVIK